VGPASGVAILAVALLTAMPSRHADLEILERAVRDAWAVRARLLDERAQRMAEAAVLADEIARRKQTSGSPARADRGLEDALKKFDRVARRLDDVDRRIAGEDRTIATLRRRFGEAASAAAAQLGARMSAGSVGEVAQALNAIDEARSRVAKLGAADSTFRAVLDVKALPDDGALELQQKVGLLGAERDRVRKRLAELDEDAKVLAVRILAKQRLAAELEAAAHTAGSELEILRRESENVERALHDLAAERERLAREKADLSGALAQVDRHLDEIHAALHQLETPRGDIR